MLWFSTPGLLWYCMKPRVELVKKCELKDLNAIGKHFKRAFPLSMLTYAAPAQWQPPELHKRIILVIHDWSSLSMFSLYCSFKILCSKNNCSAQKMTGDSGQQIWDAAVTRLGLYSSYLRSKINKQKRAILQNSNQPLVPDNFLPEYIQNSQISNSKIKPLQLGYLQELK